MHGPPGAQSAPDLSRESVALSVVIPVYNEEESLQGLYEALQDALRSLDRPWEVILIDDGSTDGSYRVMKELHARDRRFRAIRFRRNFGQTAALAAGFDHARGDVVVTMDADLQNDPHDIPMLLATMEAGGYDVVSGWRVKRRDALLTRRLPSVIANWLISRITGVHLHDYGCSLKAYRSQVTRNIHLYGELHRFVPALANWMGVTVKEVPVQHHPRRHGRSKYNLSRVPRVILDLLTVSFLVNYAARPMQVFGLMGMAVGAGGFVLAAYLTALKVFRGATLSQRPLLWLAILCIIVGLQFVSMGLLGELVIRTYYEAQHKPIYAVREIVED